VAKSFIADCTAIYEIRARLRAAACHRYSRDGALFDLGPAVPAKPPVCCGKRCCPGTPSAAETATTTTTTATTEAATQAASGASGRETIAGGGGETTTAATTTAATTAAGADDAHYASTQNHGSAQSTADANRLSRLHFWHRLLTHPGLKVGTSSFRDLAVFHHDLPAVEPWGPRSGSVSYIVLWGAAGAP
jgi:hypothetical protein